MAARVLACLTACVGIAVLTACGGNKSTVSSASTPPTAPLPSNPPLLSNPSQPAPAPLQVGSVTINPQNAATLSGQSVRFTAIASTGGPISWAVNGVPGGNSSLGTIDATGNYTAPALSQSKNVVVYAALTQSPSTDYATAPVALIQSGQVTGTANPQVAQYSVYLPQPGSVSIQFGRDISYGQATWSRATPTSPSNYGGPVSIEVAGMRASTIYHMRALITLANGVTLDDSDHPFTTGVAPPTSPVQITLPSGQTPQPGVELFNTVPFNIVPYPEGLAQAFATDLSGNVIWTYRYAGSAADTIFPIKLLPNGHLLVVIGYVALPTAQQNVPAGTVSAIREIDLAGNTIRELNVAALNQSLAAHGYATMTLLTFHNDVLLQPNGHWVVLAWMSKPYTDLPGYPGTSNVLGDVIVDVDQNSNPVWVWSSFDHMDINRHPYLFPDWTHSNALLYSADDYNLLLSVRNQNWIIKIDYQDGAGSGDVLWRLGEGGDFKLMNGVDPTDWFYAQHGPSFFSMNTTGVFTLGVFDDGNDRQFPVGVTCSPGSAPACLYSTAPVLQVDESSMTATMVSHYIASPGLYSYFGGQTGQLANTDIEVDFCSAKNGAVVQEFAPTPQGSATAPAIVWQATTPGYNQYRVYRVPSLYPGVRWD